MQAKKIDLNDFRRSGEGANGASYDCIPDPEMMVKLYNADYPVDTIFTEQEVAAKVYSLGVPSPMPGELVTDGERYGIMFRRVAGKRSFARAFADEPERVEEYSREFARLCKRLHNTECPKGMFPEAKDQFRTLLKADKVFSESEKKVVYDFIENAPDCTTALHGDMHFGNALTTLPLGAPKNTPHDVFFIDLGYFARGCPLFDMGMMMNICLTADEEFRQHDFHVPGELTKEVWKYFVDEYFFGPDRTAERMFGPGQTFDTVNAAIEPYMALKLLLVEFNIGVMPDNYVPLVRRIFGFDK